MTYKRYYITGVSGTGKSTLTQELKRRGLNAVDLDTGLCSWKNTRTLEEAIAIDKDRDDFYHKNDWYCDEEQLHKLLKEQNGDLFVFGACANQDEFLQFFNKIFLLKCNPDTFTKRILLRTNNDYGKHPAELRNELQWFEEFNNHLIAQGAVVINVEAFVEDVIDEIISHLN